MFQQKAWVVLCSMPCVTVLTAWQRSNKSKKKKIKQDLHDIEDFVAFSFKSLEGFAILDGGAKKTVAEFTIVQPVADQYEVTTIETTDVGFTFETEAASTNIQIAHSEFPKGIPANVVSNERTPFLIGLDVIREYGLVIDYHYNRVHSHNMKHHLPCAFLPTGHLALEMMPSKIELGQRPASHHGLSTRRWGKQQQRAQEKGARSLVSST